MRQSVEPAEQPVAWPRPISAAQWSDADGVLWRRRGGLLPARKIGALLLEHSVQVLLCYGLEPHLVPESERSDLWERMRPYVSGRGVRDAGDLTSFDAAEFRDDRRRSLLIIEESC